MRHRKTKIHKGGGIRMKANINRVVSRLEDIYQCGKKRRWNVHENGILRRRCKRKRTFCILAKRLGMTCHVDEAGKPDCSYGWAG